MDTVPPHARKGNIYTIYALVDPRNDSIRYIGISKDVYSRMRQHSRCEGNNVDKNSWIEELQQEQLMFIMLSLEKVNTFEEALARELYWIAHYLQQGAILTNRAGVKPAKQPQTNSTSFVRYDTSTFLRKLYFYDVSGEFICFMKATSWQFAAYIDCYVEYDWTSENLDSEFSPWNANGFRCKVLNQLRLKGYQLEMYDHHGKRITNLVGNPFSIEISKCDEPTQEAH